MIAGLRCCARVTERSRTAEPEAQLGTDLHRPARAPSTREDGDVHGGRGGMCAGERHISACRHATLPRRPGLLKRSHYDVPLAPETLGSEVSFAGGTCFLDCCVSAVSTTDPSVRSNIGPGKDQFDESRWLYATPCSGTDTVPPCGQDRVRTACAGAGQTPASAVPRVSKGHAATASRAAAVAPVSLEEWTRLDLHEIRNRAERLGTTMEHLGRSVRLNDFEIIKKMGDGANAFAYLARCKAEGQLGAHMDALVAIKVLLRYKQPANAALGVTTSGMDRGFLADVEKEIRGPGFAEYRFNVVSFAHQRSVR